MPSVKLLPDLTIKNYGLHKDIQIKLLKALHDTGGYVYGDSARSICLQTERVDSLYLACGCENEDDMSCPVLSAFSKCYYNRPEEYKISDSDQLTRKVLIVHNSSGILRVTIDHGAGVSWREPALRAGFLNGDMTIHVNDKLHLYTQQYSELTDMHTNQLLYIHSIIPDPDATSDQITVVDFQKLTDGWQWVMIQPNVIECLYCYTLDKSYAPFVNPEYISLEMKWSDEERKFVTRTLLKLLRYLKTRIIYGPGYRNLVNNSYQWSPLLPTKTIKRTELPRYYQDLHF